MSLFGSSTSGKHQVDVAELQAFQQCLKEYQAQLTALDQKLKRGLDRLATSYSDNTYQLFRDHVNAEVVKRHQDEQARVQRMITHFGKLIQHYSEIDRTRRNLGNL